MVTCNQTIIDNNRALASAIDPHRQYRRFTVTIASSDPTTGLITFMIGANLFRVLWGDLGNMWPTCPTTLGTNAIGSDAGPPPRVNDSGDLYLSEIFLSNNNISFAPTTPKFPRPQ